MRKLLAIAGIAAAALGGIALAANHNSHVMSVPLPDGSVARIEYVGDVAPKVSVAPVAAPMGEWSVVGFPSFTGFDRMMADMNRQTESMVRQAQEMARQSQAVPGAPTVASFGNAPAGVTSTTVVSVSNGGGTCTRSTETVSQGAGKPPKVTTNVSGNCGAGGPPAERSAAPINRT